MPGKVIAVRGGTHAFRLDAAEGRKPTTPEERGEERSEGKHFLSLPF